MRNVGAKSLSDARLVTVAEEIVSKIQSVMSDKIRQTVMNFEECIPAVESNLRLENYTVITERRPEQIKEDWSKTLDEFYSKNYAIISEQNSIGEADKKKIVLLLQEQAKTLNNIPQGLIDENINQLTRFLKTPTDLSVAQDLKVFSEVLKAPGHKSLSALEDIMKKLERVQSTVDNLRDDRKVSKKITLKQQALKDDVFQSVIEIKENVASTIRDNLGADVQTVDTFILSTQPLFKKKATNSAELEEIKKEYTETMAKFKTIDEEVKSLDKKMKIISDFGFRGNQGVNIQATKRKWDNFAMKIGGVNYAISSAEGGIKKKIKSDLERMSGEIDKFYIRIQELNNYKIVSKEDENTFSNQLKDVRRQWDEIQQVIGQSLSSADTFNVDLSDLGSLNSVREYFKGPFAQWMVYFDYLGGIEKMEKEEWIAFKYNIYDFQKYILEWEDKLKGKSDPASRMILDQCSTYKDIWPGLKAMIGEGFQRNHWTELFAMIGLPKSRPFNEVTFGEILGRKDSILAKIDDVKFLAARAQGEIALREALADLQSWTESTVFTFTEYQDQSKVVVPIIKEWTDVLTEVSDNQVILQNIKDSKFSGNFTDQIEAFESKMGGLDEYILKLNQIQRKWAYLEPVFGRGALPSEQGRFRRIDDEFRSIMSTLSRDPQVVTLALIPNVLDSLEMLIDQLDRCQKALNSYLEEKRNIFPRFYFLGDDDLLELLGQSTNINIIHTHLRKLFTGVAKLGLVGDDKKSKKPTENDSQETGVQIVENIKSSRGETIVLKEKVTLTKDVETWLGNLSNSVSGTIEALLSSAIKEGGINISKYPGQILEIADSVYFTEKVVQAIKGNSLEVVRKEYVAKLTSLTTGKGKLNSLDLSKAKNLILDIIHEVAVVDELLDAQVQSTDSWPWFKQLKYYMEGAKSQEPSIMVGMAKAFFPYTYEYQGNQSKLVHTPLTDKCYLTLTQGMMMGYGGNPYGPAGTGKTESVKALGYAFGRQVLVFNCDEGIDYQSMGRIFIGLVKCGAWGCFDEFNRLLEDQLSAISQQIQVIQYAIKEGIPKVQMLGQETSVSKDAGIFVTMNPAGKGYGGRSKLPDNLKQLFRPVAMSKPDNEMISEFLLFSEGYSSAKKLARKIVTVFTLSRQLLSAQQHYDWGLRALKTILVVAGQLAQQSFETGQKLDDKTEAELLIKAIRVNTMSKLTFSDTKKFEALMANVFIGVGVEDVKYEELTEAIKKTLEEMKFAYVERQVSKIKQFYEAVRQRMGVVLVGPSGCSKTTIWKILRLALKKLGKEVKIHILNPKSVSRTELLGNMNNETREFVDGILTSLCRKVVKEPPEVMNWIICDGDVDPEWIESLNSVLDDNHLLTLPNGERIALGSNVNFIFETHDLKFASPATVSRMGMMYLNNEDINIEAMIQSWLKDLPTLASSYLSVKLLQSLDEILKILIANENSSVVESTRVGLISNLLSHLKTASNDREFAISLYRGLTGSLKQEKRQAIIPEVERISGYKLADDDLITEFQGNVANSGQYLPTPESREVIGYLRPWVKDNEPFIVAGPEGCGKETIIRAAFSELPEKVRFVTIYCNSQLTSRQVLNKIYEHTIKSTVASGKIIKPKDCTRLVIFVKDINLPRPDKYQTTEVVSLLQQILTHNGFYDENLEFVSVDKRLQIVATLNPIVSFGRYKLSTRFTANVRLLSIEAPSRKELSKIYHSMIKSYSQESGLNLSADALKRSAVFLTEVYETVSKNFQAQKYVHYIFTPRDVSKIMAATRSYQILNEAAYFDVLQSATIEVFGNKLATVDDHYNFHVAVVEKAKAVLETGMIEESRIFTRIRAPDGKIREVVKTDFEKILKQELLGYEKSHEELVLNFNDEVIDFIVKAEHILGTGGHLLAVGTSGNGRRLLIKYTSHLLGLEFKTFYPTRVYKLREFKKDMRKILEIAGIQNKPSVLLLEDHHFEDEANLDLVNTFLSSGDVQGLIKTEEIEQALSKEGVEELMKQNLGSTVMDSFILRVKQNLRIVISLDHSSPNFVNQISFNPALLKVCSIIWSREWKLESKQRFLVDELSKIKGAEDLVGDQYFQKVFLQIYLKTGKPLLYLFDYIKCFDKIRQSKIGSIGDQHKRLTNGLSKITEANQEVDVIKRKAEVMRTELAVKQQEADEALNTITKAVETASTSKSEAENLRKYLMEEEDKTKDSKIQVETELAKVEPIITEAKKGIKSISKNQINELKAYTMCPEQVITVFNALFILIGKGDCSWGTIKNDLKQSTFLEGIMNFDARNIGEKERIQTESIISKNPASFDHAKIFNVSQAAGPIALFVVALCKLSKVLHQIRPLELELEQVDKKLASSRSRLLQCEKTVSELDSKVKEYKEQFSQKTQEAAQLKDKLSKVEDTLDRAQGLLSKLTDERDRWSRQANEITTEVALMPYNCLLSSAFCIFLSEAEEKKREADLAYWKKISKNDSFDFCKFNFSESQFLKWKANGHPSDQLSLENTTIYFNTSKYPLIIDPSGRIETWVRKSQEGNKDFECVLASDEKLLTQLDLAVRFGKTLLVAEASNVDSFYLSLLRKDLQRQAGRMVVLIGEKSIDFNPSFNLVFSTRDTTIDLHPKIKSTLSVINYSVTKSGLEMQLLSIVINHEKPELEEKKIKILEQEDAFKVQLAEVENQLLGELATSTGNLLENRNLIISLEEAKSKSETITENLRNSKKITESIDRERELYKDLSLVGADVFLLLKELPKISNMYRFSLGFYIEIFKRTLEQKPQGNVDIEAICAQLLKNTMISAIIGMSNRDRMTMALHMIHGIKKEFFGPEEWEYFTDEAVPVTRGDSPPSWLPSQLAERFDKFSGLFKGLVSSLSIDTDMKWKKWFGIQDCENHFPSGPTDFQKVILTKMFREDRLESSLMKFIQSVLGTIDILAPKLDLEEVFLLESAPEAPVLFITSPGSDPSSQLEEFAAKKIGRENFMQMSLGGNQNEAAMKMLKEGAELGQWVFLKNLHLVPAFLSLLEREFAGIQKHKKFRLWLTTEPQDKFPAILLEACYKVSYESPPGVKNSIERAYSLVDPDYFTRSSLHAQIVFVLSYFHSILQERRNFIPQGWTKFYEFSYSDFVAALKLFDTLEITKPTASAMATLVGLFENAIYGGRIDNEIDMRLLKTYLEKYFNLSVFEGKQPVFGTVNISKAVNVETSLRLFESLPEKDTPESFGLCSTADVSVQKLNVAYLTTNIKKMKTGSAGSIKFDTEAWTNGLSSILKVWKVVYKQLIDSGIPKVKDEDLLIDDPIASLILTEIRTSLSNVKKLAEKFKKLVSTLKAEIPLEKDVEEFGTTLLEGKVPEDWDVMLEDQISPAEWLQTYFKKLIVVKSWQEAVENASILKSDLSLSEIFNPDIFLNAYKLYSAQQQNISVDELALHTTFDKEQISSKVPPLKVRGLLLQGCTLVNKKLDEHESEVSKSEYEVLPTCYMSFKPKSEVKRDDSALLPIPLFTNLSREKHIVDVVLPYSGSRSGLIIKSAALAINP